MATIVNNPQPNTTSNGSGFLVGVILLIVFALLFFIYGLPYLGSAFRGMSGGTNVNVPDHMNVNVQTPQK